MNTTVNVVLFKSKTLANGEHPLMIRACKDNKKKYQSLGLSANPQYWDFEKNKPRRNCPNKEHIQNRIAEKIRELSDQVLEFKVENKNFNKHLDIFFSDIDFNWLTKYETWQRSNGLAINSIGVRFRTLRALFNTAIQANHVKKEYYPSKEYKVSKLKEETIKRSIQKSQVEQILNYQTDR